MSIMEITGYNKDTRRKVERFLQKRKEAVKTEIQYLGGKKCAMNWQSLKIILVDLQKEGKVRMSKIGQRVILYEWIGE